MKIILRLHKIKGSIIKVLTMYRYTILVYYKPLKKYTNIQYIIYIDTYKEEKSANN